MNAQIIQELFNSLKMFSTFSGQIMAIDESHVLQIIFNSYEPEEMDEENQPTKFREMILIVYKNGAIDRLSATDENRRMANEILKKIRSAATPK